MNTSEQFTIKCLHKNAHIVLVDFTLARSRIYWYLLEFAWSSHEKMMVAPCKHGMRCICTAWMKRLATEFSRGRLEFVTLDFFFLNLYLHYLLFLQKISLLHSSLCIYTIQLFSVYFVLPSFVTSFLVIDFTMKFYIL